MGFSIVSDKYLFIPRYESLANISDIGTSITQSECISSKYSFIISSISSCEKYIVEDGDIIITAKNSTIKSAIYRGNKIYKDILSGNLIAIRVNKNIINPYYLKAFIDSKVGALALRSIQTGTSIITITVNGLKEMKISLLSEEDQEAIGEEYKINLENMIDLMEKYKIAARHSIQIFDEARINK